MIDLTARGWAVFGARGSGKSVLVAHILGTARTHLIYDPLGEHKNYRRYVPDDRHSVSELDAAISVLVTPRRFGGQAASSPDMFVIDEANKYVAPKPSPLPKGIADLVDYGRHYPCSVGFVARRMAQFHTDIVELADAVFIFRLAGRNDYRYLEELHQGLGDVVRGLPKYHFASLAQGKVTVHAPVPRSTAKAAR
tara:strand:+ start:51 stop:635 length:585 start_codon:yes stop_codon:yes gene_type:complete